MSSISEAAKKVIPLFALPLNLAYTPYARHLYEQTRKFTELVEISGKNTDWLKAELAAYPGSIDALKAFWMLHGCFPSELGQ